MGPPRVESTAWTRRTRPSAAVCGGRVARQAECRGVTLMQEYMINCRAYISVGAESALELSRAKKRTAREVSSSRKQPAAMPKERKKCPHGRDQYVCKECGGAGICIHGRKRSVCKVEGCGGASICPHGRRRSDCKVEAAGTPRSVPTAGSAVRRRQGPVRPPEGQVQMQGLQGHRPGCGCGSERCGRERRRRPAQAQAGGGGGGRGMTPSCARWSETRADVALPFFS